MSSARQQPAPRHLPAMPDSEPQLSRDTHFPRDHAPRNRWEDDQRTVLGSRQDLIDLANQLQALARAIREDGDGMSHMPSGSGFMLQDPDECRPPKYDVSRKGAQPHLKGLEEGHGALTGRDPRSNRSQRARYLDLARTRYDARRRRNTAFKGTELFGEPAWDILLDLYIAYAEDKRVSVSSACIGSASPPTTGLRWLGVLQEAGLVEREHDSRDQRRVLVHLSQDGVAKMEAYFEEALALGARDWR